VLTALFLSRIRNVGYVLNIEKVKASVPVHAIKAYGGSGGIVPLIFFFYLGAGCRWVVSHMPRPLYTRGKMPLYPLNGRPSVFHSPFGRFGKDMNLPCRDSTRTVYWFNPLKTKPVCFI
jgi:hypothetical protein